MSKNYDMLNKKKYVSVPDLQAELQCDYTNAKKYIQDLIEKGIISETPAGIYYTINTCSLHPRTLTEDETEMYYTVLSHDEFTLLDKLKTNGRMKVSDFSKLVNNPECDLSYVLHYELIHEFNGWYYLSITEESAEALLCCSVLEAEDELVAYVAQPLLSYCIDNQKDPADILRSDFLSASCKEYIEKGYDNFKRRKIKSPVPKRKPRMKNKNIIKFEIIEAFISAFDFNTKQAYEDEANRQLAAIEAEPAYPDIFKTASRDAVNEICNELTYGNIREIRRIICSS